MNTSRRKEDHGACLVVLGGVRGAEKQGAGARGKHISCEVLLDRPPDLLLPLSSCVALETLSDCQLPVCFFSSTGTRKVPHTAC